MDSEFKKLLAGASWAENGDRVDMDDPSIQPTIDRDEGYPVDFSTDTTPTRARINQILRELTGAAKEVVRGVSDYDAEIDYPQGSMCQVSGDIYYALQAHSSASPVNPLTLNQTTWSQVGGRTSTERTKPGEIPTSNIFIDGDRADSFQVWWYPPDNGGHEITQTQLRYDKVTNFQSSDGRQRTAVPGANIQVDDNDSDLWYVSLRARNTLGWGPWSAAKRVRTSPVLPGNIFSTVVDPTGNGGRLDVQWGAPETNGLEITGYRVQWKSGNEVFSDTQRRINVVSTSFRTPISNLDPTTEYTVRVIAISNRNTQSDGGLEVKRTPSRVSDTPARPIITTEAVSATRSRAWLTAINNDGGENIDYYEWSYRVSGTNTWVTTNTTTQSFIIKHDRGVRHDVRVRAHNSNGFSSYSSQSGTAIPAFNPSKPVAPIVAVNTSNTAVPGTLKGVVSFSMGNISRPEIVKDRIIQTAVRWAPTGGSSWTELEGSTYNTIGEDNFAVSQTFPATGNIVLDTPLDVQARWRNGGTANQGWSDWSSTVQLGAVTAPSGNLVLSSNEIDILEGQSTTMTVRLSRRPIEDTVVTLTHTNTDLTVSPSTLTFTESNWGTDQTVTLSTTADSDNTNDVVNLVLSTSGGLSVGSDTVVVTIREPARLVAGYTDGTINIPEGGNADMFLGITAEPLQDVVINITKTGSSDVTIRPGDETVTFTRSNWRTQKAILIRAAADADSTNDTATLTFTATGGITDSFTRNVVVADGVTRVTMTATPAGASIGVGLSKTFNIVMDAAPAAGFTLNLKPVNTTQVNISPSTMTFTRTNWNTPQTATVSIPSTATVGANEWIALEPQNAPDVQAHSIELFISNTLVESSTAAGYVIPEGSEIPLAYSLHPRDIGVRVNGTWPSGNTVTITPSSQNPDLSFHPTTNTIAYNSVSTIPAYFTITSAQDSDVVSENLPVVYTASGGLTATLSVPTMVLEPTNAIVIPELSNGVITTPSGSAATPTRFHIRLLNEPSATVSVTYAFTGGAVGLFDRDGIFENSNRLQLTSSNYNNTTHEAVWYWRSGYNDLNTGDEVARFSFYAAANSMEVSIPILRVRFVKG